MRYIKKNDEPAFMTSWKQEREKAGQPLDYESFSQKKVLNDILRAEQHGICCYCQQSIDHFQGALEGGAHNEHLIPEKGPDGDFSKQMDYGNLYACCIDSKGTPKREKKKRHCGEAKEDKLIHPFIQDPLCSSFFRYNILGEIIPNGPYDRWEDYEENVTDLTGLVLKAYQTISTLNLNCNFLKDDRKKEINRLISIISTIDKARIQAMIQNFENREIYPRYVDMLLYYMRQHV